MCVCVILKTTRCIATGSYSTEIYHKATPISWHDSAPMRHSTTPQSLYVYRLTGLTLVIRQLECWHL